MTENRTVTAISPQEEILGQLVHALQDASDHDAVVQQFVERHPDHADAIRSFGAAERLIGFAAPRTPAKQLQENQMLGPFRIVRFIADGGMGEIYEAIQVDLKRRVALKVIRADKVDQNTSARFAREQEVLAKLHQTHIVPVFASGEENGLKYYAMHYIEGASLGKIVHTLKSRETVAGALSSTMKLPELARAIHDADSKTDRSGPGNTTASLPSNPEAESTHYVGQAAKSRVSVAYFRDIAEALADAAEALHTAHDQGIYHRDIKPSNLMIEATGKCWLIDFGLASPPPNVAIETVVPTDSRLTNSFLGTPAYMAPEQFDRTGDEKLWDVWGLGATLYELLTLQLPFGAGRPFQADSAGSRPESPTYIATSLRTINADIPRDLEAICLKAMRKEPGYRYQSAKDFAEDLRRWLTGRATMVRPDWHTLRPVRLWAWRNKAWAATIGLIAVLVIATVYSLRRADRLKTDTANEKAEGAVREREIERLNAESAIQKAEAADQKVKIKDRLLGMVAFQRELAAPHTAGWRDRLWEKGKTLAQGGKEPELRDDMVGLLAGLDAMPVDFKDDAASALAFDSSGHRLLMGGFDKVPTRVRDLRTSKVRRSSQWHVSAIGWRGDVPVQLVPPTLNERSFQMWNVDRDEVIERLSFANADPGRWFEPPDPLVIQLTMSQDTTCVAVLVRRRNGTREVRILCTGKQDTGICIPIKHVDALEFQHEMALSPDGSLLAMSLDMGKFAVWKLDGRSELTNIFHLGRSKLTSFTFARHYDGIAATQRKPNGVPGWLIGAGNAGGMVAVWNLESLDQVMVTRESHWEINAIGFSNDGQTVFSTGRAECRAWDLTSGRQVLNIQRLDRNWISSLALCRRNLKLALGSLPAFDVSCGVDLYDFESQRGIHELRGLTGQVALTTITNNGKWAAAATQDQQVGVWNVETGELLLRQPTPSALYVNHNDIRLTEDGKKLFVAGGREVHCWEIPAAGMSASPRMLDSWKLNPGYPNQLAIATDGIVRLCRYEIRTGSNYPLPQFVSESDPGRVRVYELGSKGNLQLAVEHADFPVFIRSIRAVPNSSRFVAYGLVSAKPRRSKIITFDSIASNRVWEISFSDPRFNGYIALDCSGKLMQYEVGSSECRLRDFDENPRDRVGRADELPALAGQYVFRNTESGLRLAKPNADSDLVTFARDEPIPGPEISFFTPNGRLLIWGSRKGIVRVADIHRVRESLDSVGMGW